MRGRSKKRGYHQSGYKQDGSQPSSNMCPVCLSFGCDPMSMSPAFRHKVEERTRKGLCPCCGQPKAHCRCKSSMDVAAGAHTIRTHNNKRRRAALADVQAGERALAMWQRMSERFMEYIDEDTESAVWHALYYHKPQTVAWEEIVKLAQKAGLGQEFLDTMRPAWN